MTGGSELASRPLHVNPHALITRLFTAYFREVWSWVAALGVRPVDLRDAVGEVFVEAWRALDDLEVAGAPRPWLFAIAAEVARTRRARAFEGFTPTDDGGGARVTIDRLLTPLTEGERVVFLVFELGGLSSAQIAELTGTPLAMVTARLRSARACVESTAARAALAGTVTADDDLRRLLSPTAHTPRELRAALQTALPALPTACDEDAVESGLLEALDPRADDGRQSAVSRRLKSL